MKLTLQQIVGQRVHNHRVRQKMSQVELAKKAGVSQSTIAQIESARKCASLDTVERLAEALDISPAEMMTPVISGKTAA